VLKEGFDMHFGPWEVVAFGSLYIGSFLLATDVGLRMSPRIQKKFSFIPRLQDSGWWAFTPFIMLTAAGAIFLAKATGLLPESGGSDTSAGHVMLRQTICLAVVVQFEI
jgi:hypothetical protein